MEADEESRIAKTRGAHRLFSNFPVNISSSIELAMFRNLETKLDIEANWGWMQFAENVSTTIYLVVSTDAVQILYAQWGADIQRKNQTNNLR